MRVAGWEERLSAVFVASMRREFVYGEHDCCLHIADSVEAVTGRDIAGAWRGRYDTFETGLKLARVRTVLGLADRLFLRMPLAMARRGDIAAVRVGTVDGRPEMMMFVVDGALLRGAAGVAIHRSAATRAWRVD